MLDYDAAPAAIMILRQLLKERIFTMERILKIGRRAGINDLHIEGLMDELDGCDEPTTSCTDEQVNGDRDGWRN